MSSAKKLKDKDFEKLLEFALKGGLMKRVVKKVVPDVYKSTNQGA